MLTDTQKNVNRGVIFAFIC